MYLQICCTAQHRPQRMCRRLSRSFLSLSSFMLLFGHKSFSGFFETFFVIYRVFLFSIILVRRPFVFRDALSPDVRCEIWSRLLIPNLANSGRCSAAVVCEENHCSRWQSKNETQEGRKLDYNVRFRISCWRWGLQTGDYGLETTRRWDFGA